MATGEGILAGTFEPTLPVSRRRLAALLSVLLVAACSNKPPVRTDRDQYADFSRYRTYAWSADVPAEPAPGDPDPALAALAWQTRTATAAQLANRGYLLTTAGDADVMVAVRCTVDERHANTVRAFARYRSAGGTQPIDEAYTFGFEEATLTVELYDAATRQMVWRGDGLVAMDAKDRNARAVATVAQMFTEFPRE
jgi:hypothetical protein